MDLLMVDLRTAQSKKSLCWQSGHADLESLLPSLSWLLGPICSFLTDYLYFVRFITPTNQIIYVFFY